MSHAMLPQVCVSNYFYLCGYTKLVLSSVKFVDFGLALVVCFGISTCSDHFLQSFGRLPLLL